MGLMKSKYIYIVRMMVVRNIFILRYIQENFVNKLNFCAERE